MRERAGEARRRDDVRPGSAASRRRPVRQPAKTRTSSVRLATANGAARRLSSVVEGWNGAMIQRSPSAISPSGARCGRPVGVDGGDDGLADQRHGSALGLRARNVWPAGEPVAILGARSVAQPQSSGSSCA